MMTVSILGSNVTFSLKSNKEDMESLVNILSCLKYDSNEYMTLCRHIRRICEKNLDANIDWSFWYGIYNTINVIDDKGYYDAEIENFREYKKHMGEPSFDWDFYSDWHKDLYGYRPR